MRIDLNFVSREYLLVRKVYAALIAGLALCLALFALTFYLHQSEQVKAEQLQEQVAAQELKLDKTEKLVAGYASSIDKKTINATYNEADFANAAIRRRVFSWTEFLNRIEAIVPDGVGITGIRPNFKSLDVDISGTAKDMDSLTSFIERLTRSEYFSDIPPVFRTSEENLGPGVGKSVQRFNLKIRYIPRPAAVKAPKDGGKE